MNCICESGKKYENCCKPFIEEGLNPQTAEELMRARYTAFAKADMDYVFKTHHPRTRAKTDHEANKQWAESCEWLGLKIVKIENGGPNDEEGSVEFIARYQKKSGGEVIKHHEKSEFKKFDHKWHFYDGHDMSRATFVREEPKIGRNEPCPCGSGLKFKKCCLLK